MCSTALSCTGTSCMYACERRSPTGSSHTRTRLRFRNDLIRLFLSAGLLPRLLAIMSTALKDLADNTVATALLSAQILCLVSQSDKVVIPVDHAYEHAPTPTTAARSCSDV